MEASGVKRFTGQGIEKTNDVLRRIYHLKSNKHDVCKDGLLTVKRMDDLQDRERRPRSYTRKNERYWNEEIKEDRRKGKRLSVISKETNQLDVDNLTDEQFGDKLKQLKCKSRIKCPKKPSQLLKDRIYAEENSIGDISIVLTHINDFG
ncbi:Hypothetical predicted protein [Paramuricea clavata]|uniref:Uncharacterized protein n=1 Tax=Paramuricea clavata TaxID=317549 RepID=A0A7D9EI95_PARCT|nr:Hypothetical predicted protein [Paramuricea clavata]